MSGCICEKWIFIFWMLKEINIGVYLRLLWVCLPLHTCVKATGQHSESFPIAVHLVIISVQCAHMPQRTWGHQRRTLGAGPCLPHGWDGDCLVSATVLHPPWDSGQFCLHILPHYSCARSRDVCHCALLIMRVLIIQPSHQTCAAGTFTHSVISTAPPPYFWDWSSCFRKPG